MGRKSQLPPARGSGRLKKKQDNGPAAFFKHRKQQFAKLNADAQQQQNQLQTTASSSLNASKGKQRELTGDDAGQSFRAAVEKAVEDGGVSAIEQKSLASTSSSFSPYEHLNDGNFHGGTKDSSLKAYGRHLRSLIEQSDVLIQVLDARDPMGSRSASSESLIAANPGKKLLLVLTKIDLVPKESLMGWLLHLRQYYPTLAFKSTATLASTGRAARKLHTQVPNASASSSSNLESASSATLLQLLKNYARSQPKGMSLTVGIFGQPNVGKSSLINSLVGARACSVAPRPGETKNLQTVLLDRKVRLIDSPGVAMPSSSSRSSGRLPFEVVDEKTMEVLRGTVKIELVEDPMTPVAEILKRADPVKVTKLYNLPAFEMEDEMGEQDLQSAFQDPPEATNMAESTQMDSTEGSPATHNGGGKLDTGMRGGDDSDSDQEDNEEDDFHRDAILSDDETDVADASASALNPSGRDSPVANYRPNASAAMPIGYDPSEPRDFVARLALIKGKRLKGGTLDMEGAARMVINDWNAGRISWFVKPPALAKRDKVKQLKQQQQQQQESSGQVVETDEQMVSVADGKQEANGQGKMADETSIVSSFAQAFDLDGLFAQADAQIFGGSGDGGAAGPKDISRPDAQPKSAQKVVSAADVSASTLGKRGRDGRTRDDSDDSEEEDSSDEEEDDDEDDADLPSSKRMTMNGAVEVGGPRDPQVEDDEDMHHAKASTAQGRGGKKAQAKGAIPSLDELSGLLSSTSNGTVDSSRKQAINGPPKRGQRNKKAKKHRSGLGGGDDADGGDVPSYLARQNHKASLPSNVKKNLSKPQPYAHLQPPKQTTGGGMVAAQSAGSERRKKRKMARREVRRMGGAEMAGVLGEMGEVTLE